MDFPVANFEGPAAARPCSADDGFAAVARPTPGCEGESFTRAGLQVQGCLIHEATM